MVNFNHLKDFACNKNEIESINSDFLISYHEKQKHIVNMQMFRQFFLFFIIFHFYFFYIYCSLKTSVYILIDIPCFLLYYIWIWTVDRTKFILKACKQEIWADSHLSFGFQPKNFKHACIKFCIIEFFSDLLCKWSIWKCLPVRNGNTNAIYRLHFKAVNFPFIKFNVKRLLALIEYYV